MKGKSHRAWRLRDRRVCVARVREWQVALRVGDPPSGAPANYLQSNTQSPPGIREANFRGAVSILQVPNQIGSPRTQSADSNLGFAPYANQSAEIALPPGKKSRNVFPRVVGAAAQGDSGEKLQKSQSRLLRALPHNSTRSCSPTRTLPGPSRKWKWQVFPYSKPKVLGRVALWLPVNIGIGVALCLHGGIGRRVLPISRPHLPYSFCVHVDQIPSRSLKKTRLRSLKKMNPRPFCLIDHHAILGMARNLAPLGCGNPWRRNHPPRNQ